MLDKQYDVLRDYVIESTAGISALVEILMKGREEEYKEAFKRHYQDSLAEYSKEVNRFK